MRLFALLAAVCIAVSVNASAADIKSISRLAAGPDDILFVADWKTARDRAAPGDTPRGRLGVQHPRPGAAARKETG
jgi:hypothetical protein